jgi:hypothetical protein
VAEGQAAAEPGMRQGVQLCRLNAGGATWPTAGGSMVSLLIGVLMLTVALVRSEGY